MNEIVINDDEIIGLQHFLLNACGLLREQSEKLFRKNMKIDSSGEPNYNIRDLTNIFNAQIYLQTALTALLSALFRRHDSNELRDRIKAGGETTIRAIEELSMEDQGKTPVERIKAYALRLRDIALILGANTLYAIDTRKINLYNAVHDFTFALNINRWLLNTTLNLMEHASRRRSRHEIKQSTRNPEPA